MVIINLDKTVGMWISIPKSEAMLLPGQDWVSLSILFRNDGKMGRGMDQWIGAVSAVVPNGDWKEIQMAKMSFLTASSQEAEQVVH